MHPLPPEKGESGQNEDFANDQCQRSEQRAFRRRHAGQEDVDDDRRENPQDSENYPQRLDAFPKPSLAGSKADHGHDDKKEHNSLDSIQLFSRETAIHQQIPGPGDDAPGGAVRIPVLRFGEVRAEAWR